MEQDTKTETVADIARELKKAAELLHEAEANYSKGWKLNPTPSPQYVQDSFGEFKLQLSRLVDACATDPSEPTMILFWDAMRDCTD